MKAIKYFLLLSMLIGATLHSMAYDFKVNTLCYNITSDTTVAVTYEQESMPRYASLSGDVTIPEEISYNNQTYRVTEIGELSFFSCGKIQSVTIPNSVVKIGSRAFSSCSSLTNITLPNRLKLISYMMLYNCRRLSSITIPESVTQISSSAFEGCATIQKVDIPMGVTSIGQKAFYNSGIIEVTLPVANVGEEAFSCYHIDKVSIIGTAERNKKITFGRDAFYKQPYHSIISSVNITDLEGWCRINFESYYSNPATTSKALYLNGELLENAIIPNTVVSINSYAFYNMQCLKSVYIPESVKKIGIDAFTYCDQLNSVTTESLEAWCNILFDGARYSNPLYYASNLYLDNVLLEELAIPASVTEIHPYAFINFTGLKKLTINDNTTHIQDCAFEGCSNLRTATLGKQVRYIGTDAFKGCKGLEDLYIPRERPAVINEKGSFEDVVYENCTLYVPIGCERLYWVANNWDHFVNIVEYDFGNTGSKYGDLNGDNEVNAGDVSELYSAILQGVTDSAYDLNGDGEVNAGDTSILYQMVLGNE